VRLVEGLRDVQRLLHVQPKLLGTHFLKRSQVERQRRSLAHALGLDGHHLRADGRAHAFVRLLRDGLLQAAPGVVGATRRRRPVGHEGLAGMSQQHLDRPERHGDEARDLAVAVHDELQRRRLHATDRQHAGIAGLAPEHSE